MEKSILGIEERERRRIGHDLHDGLGQLLTGISFRLRTLGRRMERSSNSSAEEIAEISILIDDAKKQSRLLAKGLSPVEVSNGSLICTLQTLISNTKERFGIQCSFTYDKHVLLFDEAIIIQLYRIAQEAVTNAVKHGIPENIYISLTKTNGNICMLIKDDGKGMDDIHTKTNGMGLKIMEYRANTINGKLEVQSSVNEGTEIVCVFPHTEKDRDSLS